MSCTCSCRVLVKRPAHGAAFTSRSTEVDLRRAARLVRVTTGDACARSALDSLASADWSVSAGRLKTCCQSHVRVCITTCGASSPIKKIVLLCCILCPEKVPLQSSSSFSILGGTVLRGPCEPVTNPKMLGVKNPSSRPGKAELCAVTTCGGESSERHTQCAPIVLVEGNIGAGKTTLIRELSEKLGFRVFLEPTAKNPYLAKFYADPKKYALKLQLWIFRQRFLTYVDAVRHVLEKGRSALHVMYTS